MSPVLRNLFGRYDKRHLIQRLDRFILDGAMNRKIDCPTADSVRFEIIIHLRRHGAVTSFRLGELLEIVPPEKRKVLGRIIASEREMAHFTKKCFKAFFNFRIELTIHRHATVPLCIQKGMGIFFGDRGLEGPAAMADDRLRKIS